MSIQVKNDPFIRSPIIGFYHFNKIYHFVGRDEQLRGLIKNSFKLKRNQLTKIVFIEGEKGSGKTSLINQIIDIADGNKFLLREVYPEIVDENLYFLVGKNETFAVNNSYEALILSIYESLIKSLNPIQKIGLKKFKLIPKLSLKFAEVAVDSSNGFSNISIPIFNEFDKILLKLTYIISTKRDGIILIMDNMDFIINDCNYGLFFKMLYEKIHNDNINNIMIILTGSRETYESLIEQENSLTRYIDRIYLTNFSIGETTKLINLALEKEDVTIDNDVIESVYNVSYGDPELIQHIGSRIYEVDKDKHIDIQDYNNGILLVIEDNRVEIKSALKKADSNDIKIIKALLMRMELEVPKRLLQLYITDIDKFTLCLNHLRNLNFIIIKNDYVMFKNQVIKSCLKKEKL